MAAVSKLRPMVTAIRCAIYTRKSTDEGLDSDFNTLDAQRESAEAFIVSQRHEGWSALPQKYDDGGFTGANMDRPAMQRLLADVRSGLVNCVVVYKVDRLTRSLLDFARIMEVLDKHGVTFVSVTQQFNSTASLGRLTLNILLSFAQFEREMISERTRDKMSAARRKGKWVGGNPVLGYDVHPDGGALVVNAEEAVRVRAIFGLYLEHGSLLPVVSELDHRGWTLKRWTTRDGKTVGGKPFTRPRLHQILTNVIYTGQVRHRGENYPGEHEAIVDRETWEKVHAQLKANAPGSTRNLRNKHGALLKGAVRCATCNVGMVHTYTQKDARLYRYYVCVKAHQRGWTQCATRSVSAPELEQAVIEQIRGIGRNPMMLTAVMRQLDAYVQGGQKVRHPLAEIFARVVLGIDHLPEPLAEDSFDLDLFKNPDITFPTNTADNINLVRVQAMRLKFHGHRAGRITVAIEDPKSKTGSVYDLIDDKLAEKHAKLTTATVLGVTLQAFMRDDDDKERIVPFKISAPATCDLGDRVEEQLLRRYLPAWGIEKHANNLATAA